MANYRQRGLDSRHEQDQLQLIRDTRPLIRRVHDFFVNPTNSVIVLVCMIAALFLLPGLFEIITILASGIFCYAYFYRRTLPFRMPKVAEILDYNDPAPGSNKPRKARGICLLGNDRISNEELWFTNEDMRTHILIFGSTGSGKTVALTSIAYNALIQASGFIYIDGKGDNSLFASVFSMARAMGREDDLLLINFMTGARDIIGPQEKRISNTMNPFSLGSSSMLSQLVVSLMSGSSANQSQGNDDMWKGRAISFVEALMKLLVYMRDAGYILLDANVIRNYFHLERLESIVMDRKFPRDKQESVDISNINELVIEPITNYVLNLPGYDKSKKGRQVSQVLEQHGFITMQLGRTFTSLADTYGHILRVKLAEVDLRDVVLNRRILVVLLPALEKAPDELSNLGKVIISSLKAMMSSGLGSEVEGTYGELITRKPTNAETPFICIMDEYGYYAVEGFAVVPAQARSLGFSAVFAGQDLPAFQKASKEEAASIGANTNIKICMKLEDPTETWEFFSKTAGESFVTKVDSFQIGSNSLSGAYSDQKSASAEKRARIDLLDLKEQREGEAHVFFKSKIVRARMFYANPKPVKFMRLNQFLRVDTPEDKQLIQIISNYNHLKKVLSNKNAFADLTQQDEEISTFLANWKKTASSKKLLVRATRLLLAYQSESAQEDFFEEEIEEIPEDELNIFSPYGRKDPMVPLVVGSQIEKFSDPLLAATNIRKGVETIERLLGNSLKQASLVAAEIIKDLRLATFYPPEIEDFPTVDEFVALTNKLATGVANKYAENEDDDDDDDFL